MPPLSIGVLFVQQKKRCAVDIASWPHFSKFGYQKLKVFLLLQDVYFPTVIVCNINQIKKSLFRSLSPDDLDQVKYFFTLT